MPQLLDCHADILLHLVQFLEVEDAVSFSLVSHGIYDILQTCEHAFLAGTLGFTRQTRPIPCPPTEDITKYDAGTLRGFLQQFNRLNRNWQHDRPQIVGPVKVFKTDGSLDALAQIPGTNYVIAHSVPKSTMSVWSTESGEHLCSVACHKRMLDLSTGWPEHGKFTLALLTNSKGDVLPTGIQVLTVDYSGPEVKVDISWSKQLEQAESRFFRSIFLYADVVGVLYMPYNHAEDEPSPLHVLAFNWVTGKETDIYVCSNIVADEIREIWENGQVGTSFWNGNLYIHSEFAYVSYQQWVPRDLLLYGDSIQPAVQTHRGCCAFVDHPDDMRHGGHAVDVEVEGILTTQSVFGVVALTIHTVLGNASDRSTLINFWVIDDASLIKARESNYLPVPSLYPRVLVPGVVRESDLSTWYLCHASNCGTYVILLSEAVEAQGIRLHMVHFKLPNHLFTVHTIETPPSVQVHLITGFFVDEYRGIVTLYQVEGEMYILNFA